MSNIIISFVGKVLKGRGLYASFLVITGWTYLFIIFLMLVLQIFLWIFKVRYNNKTFQQEVQKNDDKSQ